MTQTLELFSRYITSDYDDGMQPSGLLDNTPRESTFRAYRALLRHLSKASSEHPTLKLDWKQTCTTLRRALPPIARNYWRDWDHDNRKKSAQIKDEVKKLLGPLSATLSVMDELPPYARQGLDAEINREAPSPLINGKECVC